MHHAADVALLINSGNKCQFLERGNGPSLWEAEDANPGFLPVWSWGAGPESFASTLVDGDGSCIFQFFPIGACASHAISAKDHQLEYAIPMGEPEW